MSVQLVHCSDLRLDKNFNTSNLARAQEGKEDLSKNFSVAFEYALKNKPDLFLITGDVFDRNSPSNSARVFVTERVRQLNRRAALRRVLPKLCKRTRDPHELRRNSLPLIS